MNTAQQVRVWVSAGLAVLLALSVVGMAGSLTSVSDFERTGKTALYTLDATAFYTWFGLAVVLMVAEAVLAGFIIYRLYNPLKGRSSGGPPQYGYPVTPPAHTGVTTDDHVRSPEREPSAAAGATDTHH